MAAVQTPFGMQAHKVGASQTNSPFSGQGAGTGAQGDLLHEILVQVSTAATSQVSLYDGVNLVGVIVPSNTPIGPYYLQFDMLSTSGAWNVTTGAGVSCIGYGIFSY